MEDFLKLDDQLSKDELKLRDSINKWVYADVIPSMPDAFEQSVFPKEIIPRLSSAGILGIKLPKEYGGRAMKDVAYGLACQELEKADSAIRSFVSIQNSLCMFPIFKYGTEEIKQKFLPKMTKGECLSFFGLTEESGGSDPSNLQTTAKKVSGGWELNGNKKWIGISPIADIGIIWAQTDHGIRGFIVEKNFEGFEAKDIPQRMSLRIAKVGEVKLNKVFVPDSHFLPGTEKGISAALSCLNEARYGIAWGAVGAATDCFDRTLAYLKDRELFGKSAASFQLIQKELADMFTEINKTQAFNLQMGRLKEKGECPPVMISMAKMNACKNALDISRRCRDLLGANGISLEYHVIRHMLNLESVYTYEGTDNIHHLIVGQYLTGHKAFC